MHLDRYTDTGRAVLGQRARSEPWAVEVLDEMVERARAAQRLRTDLAHVLLDGGTGHVAAVEKVRALAASFLDGSWRPWAWPETEEDG